MQPSRWQLCPSKGTCSWWLFAHLPLRPERCRRVSALCFCFNVLPILSATVVKCLPAEQAACANISWAMPPPACSSSERLAGFQHFITFKTFFCGKFSVLTSVACVWLREWVWDVRVCVRVELWVLPQDISKCSLVDTSGWHTDFYCRADAVNSQQKDFKLQRSTSCLYFL